MTRQEFIQSRKRNSYRVVLPGFSTLFVMVVLPFVWRYFQEVHPDMPLAQRLAGHLICVAFFVFGIWFVYAYSFRVQKRNQHWCPHCKEGFGGSEDTVLKTGRCHYCGFQIIDDAANHSPLAYSGLKSPEPTWTGASVLRLSVLTRRVTVPTWLFSLIWPLDTL
jgi:DNA-directed RNA polymerase subunit RPC12/RpoP